MENLWTVILAGGKGTRMKSKDRNKVTLEVAGKPMIMHTISNLNNAGIHNIVMVVGFAKESVMNLLDNKIRVAYQQKRLGTGHALKIGMHEVAQTAHDVLVLYGDDSFIYRPEIFKQLYELHTRRNAALTFVTLNVDNPQGLGRIVRNKDGRVAGIVEEKDATDEQKQIREINPACYIFSFAFLKKNIEKVPKSSVTGEYYLTSLIEMAVEQNVTIETLTIENLAWRGVNTPDELAEANKLLSV